MPVSSLNAIRTERGLPLLLLVVLLCSAPAAVANSPFGSARSGGLGAEPRFLPVDEAFRWHLSLDAADQVSIHWQIAPEYYLYREQFQFRLVDTELDFSVSLPEAVPHNDVYFGDVEVYYDHVQAIIRFPEAPQTALTLEIRYQGCAEAGLCYPPERRKVQIQP